MLNRLDSKTGRIILSDNGRSEMFAEKREVSGRNGRVGISELGVLTLSYSCLYKIHKFLIEKN